jgi:hypothetical protein
MDTRDIAHHFIRSLAACQAAGGASGGTPVFMRVSAGCTERPFESPNDRSKDFS